MEADMAVMRIILRVIGWLLTIIFQIAAAYFVIFLFTVIFAGVDTTSRLGWLTLLFFIWLGYVIGVNLVGQIALRWIWKDVSLNTLPRLIGSAIGALIPLLVLLPIGYSVPVGDTGTQFYNLVTSTWQPILTQAALFTALVGYYVPGVIKLKRTSSVE